MSARHSVFTLQEMSGCEREKFVRIMSRREIRECIFRILFQINFHKNDEMGLQIERSLDETEGLSEDDREYMERKLRDICEHLSEIDALINEKATRWKTNRMAKVDLTLIRLAVYEMKYEENIPTGVAINEAVEIAKSYGNDGSPSFVNGVLAKLA